MPVIVKKNVVVNKCSVVQLSYAIGHQITHCKTGVVTGTEIGHQITHRKTGVVATGTEIDRHRETNTGMRSNMEIIS